MVNTRLYCDGVLTEVDFAVANISDHITVEGCAVWADFIAPTADDLASITEELGLHTLAVEDAVHDHQRPKLDRYDTHLFLACYFVSLNEKSGKLTRTEVKAFITPRALVTVHSPDFDMTKVVERWNSDANLAVHGVAFLLWGLLDVIIDGHSDVVVQLDTAIESLEDALFDETPRDKDVQRQSFEFRKSLVELHRVIMPMREVVNTILHRDIAGFDRAMDPYYHDVYDHVLRVTEEADSLRDLVNTIFDTNLSIQSNRMNLIMKKVTSWAAIIAVPTAITGYFGQNLKFAGVGTEWGVWVSLGLITAVSVALYASFKKRDWI